jgi:hypothetical protein
MKSLTFYLAGPFMPIEIDGKKYDDWRDYIIENVPRHKFIDPRDNDQNCPATFTKQDLESVIRSDGLFVYRPRKCSEAIGGACEHGIALGFSAKGKKKIPIIYIDECFFPFPFLAASAKRTFTNLKAAVVYLNFLKSWDKEFEAINKYIEWEKGKIKI